MTTMLWLLGAAYLLLMVVIIAGNCTKHIDLSEAEADKFSRMVKK